MAEAMIDSVGVDGGVPAAADSSFAVIDSQHASHCLCTMLTGLTSCNDALHFLTNPLQLHTSLKVVGWLAFFLPLT